MTQQGAGPSQYEVIGAGPSQYEVTGWGCLQCDIIGGVGWGGAGPLALKGGALGQVVLVRVSVVVAGCSGVFQDVWLASGH